MPSPLYVRGHSSATASRPGLDTDPGWDEGFLWSFRMWQCGCNNCETDAGAEDIQVQMLSSEYSQPGNNQQHELTSGDSFDITFTPRSMEAEGFRAVNPVTPRQRDLQGQLELPALESYPLPPWSSPNMPADVQRQQLLQDYQGFALDLHRGMYLTQLMADRSYSDIHCQLMEDMSTLKLDQSTGRIIEFPLANVSKVYRLTKNAGKWYPAEKQKEVPPESEQIIVVVFSKRKLAFVFRELKTCQRFMFCLELLIWRAQQLEGVPLLRSSATPKYRSLPAAPELLKMPHSGPCPTPRLVRDSQDPPKVHRGDKGDWKEGFEGYTDAAEDMTDSSRTESTRAATDQGDTPPQKLDLAKQRTEEQKPTKGRSRGRRVPPKQEAPPVEVLENTPVNGCYRCSPRRGQNSDPAHHTLIYA